MIGGQLAAVGRLSEARALLKKSYRQMPNSPDVALALARVLRAMNEDTEILAVLDPFLHPPFSPRYEIIVSAAWARLNVGQAAASLELFDRLIASFGVTTDLLNGAGEARAALGQANEALAAWEQSLKINPNQPEVRKRIEAMKEKK
jgi:tetratricopeptide (TPR) repeat protein